MSRHAGSMTAWVFVTVTTCGTSLPTELAFAAGASAKAVIRHRRSGLSGTSFSVQWGSSSAQALLAIVGWPAVAGGHGGSKCPLTDEEELNMKMKALAVAATVAFFLSAIWSSPGMAATDDGRLGGPHDVTGVADDTLCPEGEAVTGVEGATRIIGGFIPIVAVATVDCTGSATASGTMGSGDGVPGSTSCPEGQVAIGVTGREGDFIDLLALRCRNADGSGPITTSAGFGGGYGTADGPYDCLEGMVLSGLRGETVFDATTIRYVEIVCSAPDRDGGTGDESPSDRARRAFSRVLRPPDDENRDIFVTYLDMALAGATYDQIVTRITRDYVTQAYDKIFRYRNDPNFSPTDKTAVPFNEEVYNTILRWVKAPGTLYIDGSHHQHGAEPIWTYVAKSASVWGAHRGSSTPVDRCFGAVGSGCKGTGVEFFGTGTPYNIGEFRRLDGVKMHYRDMDVAVGSILHDRSCLDGGYIAYCTGWPDERSGQMEKDCDERNVFCAGVREWWKAWDNAANGRTWRYRFGPYPVDDGLAGLFTDDLRVVATRRTFLPLTNGDKELGHEYTNGEARATTVLIARGASSLDYTDAAFCYRGQTTSKTHKAPFSTPWIRCEGDAAGGGGGGIGRGDPPVHNR